jgi:hypothetical protein
MAYSSILGAEIAPAQPGGRDAESLGPSDNSDSGSDAIGTFEAHADSDAVGTGERGAVTPGVEGREGGDILPDRIVAAGSDDEAPDTIEGVSADLTDLDEAGASESEDAGEL